MVGSLASGYWIWETSILQVPLRWCAMALLNVCSRWSEPKNAVAFATLSIQVAWSTVHSSEVDEYRKPAKEYANGPWKFFANAEVSPLHETIQLTRTHRHRLSETSPMTFLSILVIRWIMRIQLLGMPSVCYTTKHMLRYAICCSQCGCLLLWWSMWSLLLCRTLWPRATL